MAAKKKSKPTRKNRSAVTRSGNTASRPNARKAAAGRKTSSASRPSTARVRKVVVRRRTRVTVTTVKTASVIEVSPGEQIGSSEDDLLGSLDAPANAVSGGLAGNSGTKDGD